MPRRSVVMLVVLAATGAGASAQVVLNQASTPQGDYLRGVGFAAAGLGQYNLNTSIAERNNVETAVFLNEYLSKVQDEHNRRFYERRKRESERTRKFNKINQDRILNSPEELDVQNGRALNSVLTKQLFDSRVDETAIQYSQIPLSADVIRLIPFQIAEEGVTFSMRRLSPRGKNKWPITLQDDIFRLEREAYERAFEDALDQQVDGKVALAAIAAVDRAIADLLRKLETVVRPSNDPLYAESFTRLQELKKSAEALRKQKVEIVVGEIERYSGTTVNDLRIFMRKYNLQFGAAEEPDERKLYPELLGLLRQQHLLLSDTPRPAE